MSGKLPWFPWYADDWLSDEKLRACSLAARGLWADLLSLMHKNDRRGYLQLSGSPLSAVQIARMTGCTPDEATRYLAELFNAGVPSALADGTVYSRRMVRDEDIRRKRSHAGSNGAEAKKRVLLKQNGQQNAGKRSGKTPASESESESESEKQGGCRPLEPPPPGGPATKKPAAKPRPRNLLFDAVVEVTGADPSLDGKHIGAVAADLAKADPPYTPAEVRALPAAVAAAGMNFTLTVGGVRKFIYLVRSKKEAHRNGQAARRPGPAFRYDPAVHGGQDPGGDVGPAADPAPGGPRG